MLSVQKNNGVLWVHFDSPETRNAFSVETARELWKRVQDPDVRSLVLSNGGSIFCAGGNLKQYAADPQNGIAVNLEISRLLDQLSRWPIAKCAVVDGGCFGGGMELLSVFDHVLATPRAQFALWQRRVGLSFGWGGKGRLLARLGAAALRRMYISAAVQSSYSAVRLGLVDEVVHPERALERAKQWVEGQNRFSQATLATFLDENLSEQEAFAKLWGSPEHKKALAPYSTKDK